MRQPGRLSAAWNAFRGRQAKYDTLDLFKEVFGGAPTWAGKDVSLSTALQVSTALACARVIADGLASLPWKIKHAQGLAIRDAVEHPLYDKLASAPNPLQTSYEYTETMGLHLALCGNAFSLINRVSGRIDELWLLEPGWVTVKYKFGELPTYEVRFPDGRKTTLGFADVWHLRGPSWISYLGLEPIKLARQALGLSMALEEGQARLQANGVRPTGVLSVDGTLTDEQYKKLRDWLAKEYEGAANAGRNLIVDRAAKWLAATMSNVDAQTVELRKQQVEEVCRFMRVMPIMIGYSDKAATYASAEQMFIAHRVHTMGPLLRRVETSCDKHLLSPEDRAAGFYTKFNEKALERMVAKDQAEFLSRLVLTGIYTRNEARAKLDENPLDGLDAPLAPANTFIGNPPAPDDKPKPTEGDDA